MASVIKFGGGAGTPEIINLSTDAIGNTATSDVLSSAVGVVGITLGGGQNSRNGAYTTTFKVQGSSNGGTTWTDLLSITIPSTVNSRTSGTNTSNNISGKYNRFRLISDRLSISWEFIVYAHATVVTL